MSSGKEAPGKERKNMNDEHRLWWESNADKNGDESLIGTVSIPSEFNVF